MPDKGTHANLEATLVAQRVALLCSDGCCDACAKQEMSIWAADKILSQKKMRMLLRCHIG